MTTTATKESYLFQSKVSEKSLMAVGGKGNTLSIQNPTTGETVTLIDGSTGAAVGALGHGDEDIANEFALAGKECVYSFPTTICNYYAEDLAKFVIENSPENAFSSAVFVGSGSEANENAMKIVKQYHMERGDHKRNKYISRLMSYHGFSLGALSIAGQTRFDKFRPIGLPLENVPKASAINPYRDQKPDETLEEYKNRLLKEMDDIFQKADPSTVGAVFVESVSGSSLSCQPPIPGYLEGVREICHKYGALFVLDEVMSGMGRCGSYHAWEQFLPKDKGPDLQTIGKTLGSGYVTIAGVLISPKVRDTITNGSNAIIGGQTYQCHSLNCRIALAVQKKIKEQNLVANCYEMGEYLNAKLREKLSDHKYVGCIRGAGLFRGIEFVKSKETKESFPYEFHFGPRFGQICLSNGLTVMGGDGCNNGFLGDQALLCPSYVIDKSTIDKMVDILVLSLDQITQEYDEANK